MSINSKMTQKTLKNIEGITGGPLTLGKVLWAFRQCEEMTQVAFAKKLEISKQHLCDLEHNRKAVSPKLAASYADKLGYSREQLIRLCLQDMIDRDGLNVSVEIKSTGHRKTKSSVARLAYAK